MDALEVEPNRARGRPASAPPAPGGGHAAEEEAEGDCEPWGAVACGFEVQGEEHGGVVVDLDGAVEGEDFSAFRDGYVEGGGDWLGGALLGDDALGDFLEGGGFLGGVAVEETAGLFGIVVVADVIDRVGVGCLFELGVVEAVAKDDFLAAPSRACSFLSSRSWTRASSPDAASSWPEFTALENAWLAFS